MNLYYETYGNGPPLLLLHGALESISSYSAIIPILAKKFKVIALDTRGHGKSTVDSTKLSYELYADDVFKFLDKLGLDSVNVLGWSGHTRLIAYSIKDSKLVIFKKASHDAPVEIPEKFAATVLDFF